MEAEKVDLRRYHQAIKPETTDRKYQVQSVQIAEKRMP